MNRIRLQI